MFHIHGAEAEFERFDKFTTCCHACLKRNGFPTFMRMRDMADRAVPAAAAAAMNAMDMMEQINHAAANGDHVNARMLSYDLADQMRIVLADRASDSRTGDSNSRSDSPKKNPDGPRRRKSPQPRNQRLLKMIPFASDRVARGPMTATAIVREFAKEDGWQLSEKGVQSTARQLRRYKAIWNAVYSDTSS